MLGNGKNTLSVSVADVLSAGSKDLFIGDGKTRVLIKGDAQDVVKLDDILGDGGDVGDWVKQQGSTTVAGVKYQVYSQRRRCRRADPGRGENRAGVNLAGAETPQRFAPGRSGAIYRAMNRAAPKGAHCRLNRPPPTLRPSGLNVLQIQPRVFGP